MLSHTPASASFDTGGLFFRDVRATAADIAALRGVVRQWLRTLALDPDCEHDIVLACYEALANAVEHAYEPDDESATLDLEATYRPGSGVLEIAVTDNGRWQEKHPGQSVGSRGHGLSLIRRLATEMDVVPSARGTRVVMRWSE